MLTILKLDVEPQTEWMVCCPRNQANHRPLDLLCYISAYQTQEENLGNSFPWGEGRESGAEVYGIIWPDTRSY